MTTQDLQDQLKEVCVQITHEARDPRLTAAEVFDYLKVVNSAAQISAGLSRRIKRVGIDKARDDIFRFVGVALNTILRIRQSVAMRESSRDPLEDAWNEEGGVP